MTMDTTIVFTHNPAVNYYFSSPAIITQEEQSIPGIVHFAVKTQPHTAAVCLHQFNLLKKLGGVIQKK